MFRTNITLDFDNFHITHGTMRSDPKKVHSTARLHNLTSEQFDALCSAFDLVTSPRSLQLDNGEAFRTADIDMGGLTVQLYSMQQSTAKNQLTLF